MLNSFVLDLLSQNKDGHTKLFIASNNNKVEKLERILKVAKENKVITGLIDKGDHENRTPLWLASFRGHLAVVKLLFLRIFEILKNNIYGGYKIKIKLGRYDEIFLN